MEPVAVTVLTGFLGAGKTTLLQALIRDSRFSDTAVVINEFGEIALDHALLEAAPEVTVEVTSGCLCCTIRGDIRRALMDLYGRAERGEVPVFSRLIVETTGLADPAPVIHTLMTDPRLARRFTLGGIVTLVDAVNGLRTLDAHPESVKQVAVADSVVFTKTDLVRDPLSVRDLDALKALVRRLNPSIRLFDRGAAGFDPAALFRSAFYDPATKTTDVSRWLRDEAFLAGPDADHEHAHQHAHQHTHDHTHDHGMAGERPDVNRHSDLIRAYCVVRDKPISGVALAAALDLLRANQGADLLRVKGIVNVRERPDTPLVIHGVQHVFHPPAWLANWPDADRRTRIVFVTRGIPQAMIEEFFDAWLAADPDSPALAPLRPR
ncbi:MAG: GTP-binding protein [Alphaproteobacteria bacterium]